MSEPSLSSLLQECAIGSIDTAFENFLRDSINIAKNIRSTASTSQNHLRQFLAGENARDGTFPVVLSENDKDFIGGSFARQTKIYPLDDIDIYVPLDGYGLQWFEYGMPQPITIVSDDDIWFNPLLYPRWMNGSYVSSQKLINGFARALNRHYPDQTQVKKNGQAVTIRMSYGETEDGLGLGFDVVPCFSMKPQNGDSAFYTIPSGSDGWIRTNPRLDNKVADWLNQQTDKTYRKTVKLIKYWNQAKLNGALNSYYIEMAIARECIAKINKHEPVSHVSFSVALGFWAVNEAVKKGDQQAFITKAPPIEPGTSDFGKLSILRTASATAVEAWNHELQGESVESMKKWKRLFGNQFGD